MASPYTRVTVSGYNTSAPSDDGSQAVANQITWAGIKTKIGDPVKTAIEAVDQGVSDTFSANPLALSSIKLDAGSSALPSLQFQAGTVVTTPVSGGIDYDGVAFYTSFAASQRGVSPSVQIATAQAKTALTNSSTSAQNIFAAAADVLTVAASTTYRFRALIMLNTGATSHTTAFDLGGTATFTAIHYRASSNSSAADTLGTSQTRRVSSAASSVLTAASTAVTTDILIEGEIRINGAGTIIPQITFSAGPTGTCEVEVGSFFELFPIGTDTVVSVGPWA